MIDTEDQDLEQTAWSDIAKWAARIIAAGAIVLALVLGTYALNFGLTRLSDDPADWGVFGDFVGGTANPILSFLTVAMLAITIILQARQLAISSRELQLSRKELELTRSELRRAASAQELSEKALRAQAKAAEANSQLATVNALMTYYSSEISRFDRQSYPLGDPRQLELQGFKDRHRVLQQRLEHMYVQLMEIDDEQRV